MDSQVKRRMGQSPEGSRLQELLSPWIWGVPPALHVDVFPNLDAFQTLYFRDFYGGSSRGHDPLLTQSPAPPCSPEDGRWGLKFQASNHGLAFLVTSHHPGAKEATKNYLIRTKDAPITQEFQGLQERG